MICIKTDLKILPDGCEDCQWWETNPHPYKGWVDWCRLCNELTNGDAKDGWHFDGYNRPRKCPLVSIEAVE